LSGRIAHDWHLTRLWGSQHARDLAWNVAGLVLPLAAAFVSIPLLMRNFGVAGFGVFSLLAAAFAYLAVLDLGFASAVTYRVSAMLARGEAPSAVVHTVITAAVASIGTGIAIGAIAYLGAGYAPLLLSGESTVVQQEAVQGLRLFALATPILFAGSMLGGVLSGYRRFGQVNAVRIVAGVAGTLGPAIASYWWPNLVVACSILVLVRSGVAVVHLVQCFKPLRADSDASVWPPSRGALGALMSFGGWLTISNALGPLMVYMDRFYLAAVRPVEEVGYYVAPYELASRIALVPAGVLPVLFPILVARWVLREQEKPQLLVQLSTAMALACALPTALFAVFGPEIMRSWTGLQVPPSSAAVLQLLAGGVFVNCVAQVFFMQLQAMGHTDIVARIHLGELVFYALLLWVLTQRWGAVGVALAWTIRVMVDALLLCAVTAQRMHEEVRPMCWQVLAMTLAFGVALSASAWLPSPAWRVLGPVALVLLLTGWRREVLHFLSGRNPRGTTSQPVAS
jgi:O-antigen/teichoic acid export membrane protein